MADDEKHPIRNGIIIAVSSGLILTGLYYFVPKLFAFILNAISSLWKYLLSNTLLPNTLLYLLIILAIPTLFNLIKYLFENKTQQASSQINISSYTSDIIFTMVWKWKFITDKDMSLTDLWCFCPKCSTRLVYSSPYDPYRNQTTIFKCENCGFHSISFVGDRREAFDRVRCEIERRVTTGEWQNAIKSEPSNSD